MALSTSLGFCFSAARFRLPTLGKEINSWYLLNVVVRRMRSEARWAENIRKRGETLGENLAAFRSTPPNDPDESERLALLQEWNSVHAKALKTYDEFSSSIEWVKENRYRLPLRASLTLTYSVLHLAYVRQKLQIAYLLRKLR
ncbi:MAG TPA: hypothetical protein VMW68_01260 [Methyloceanibacter sp.]|nr:hypothetical protein [Methyloceanibacter sp.]